MKKIFSFLFCFNTILQADSIGLAWNANTPTPDGYRLFQRINTGVYNYSTPIIPSGISNGNIPSNTTQVTINDLNANEIKTIYFVVRSHRDSGVYSSSQEIPIIIDRRTLSEPVNLRITIPVQ